MQKLKLARSIFLLIVISVFFVMFDFREIGPEPFSAATSDRDSVTLFFIPSEPRLDWSSPQRLARSAIRNYVSAIISNDTHPIGHTIVKIKCGEADEPPIWTAVSGGGLLGDLKKFGFGDLGFGLLTAVFSGHMVAPEISISDVLRRISNGHIRWISVRLSPDTCNREITYYHDFVKRRIYKRFGLGLMPLTGGGAGCTTFALSFLTVAGIAEMRQGDFVRSVNVPKAWVGTALHPAAISAWDILFSQASRRWPTGDVKTVSISFWDPTMIFDWIGEVWKGRIRLPRTLRIRKGRLENSIGIVLDERSLPPPNRPIFSRGRPHALVISQASRP